MRAVITSVLIAIAVVATVALMPVSSWVFRNQVDLFSRFGSRPFASSEDDLSTFMPSWLNDPATYSGADPSQELAHAMYLPLQKRNAALEKFLTSHPKDPLGWAVLVRMICVTGSRAPDDLPSKDPASDRTGDSIFKMGREACVRGEILEPDNAYFPLMRATFDMNLNMVDDISRALSAAASKSTYDNHLSDEALALEKAQVSAKGYRGELVRTGMDASMWLPDYSHMKSLARYLNRKGTLTEKRDLIRTEYTSARREQTAIGMLVAFADVRIVLESPVPLNTKTKVVTSDSEWLRLASEFDARLKASNIVPPTPGTLETYNTLNRLVAATKKYLDTRWSSFQEAGNNEGALRLVVIQTVGPFVALAAVVFSLVFAAMAWGLNRIQSDTFRTMAPHVLCLPVWLATIWLNDPCINCSDLPTAGLVFGIAQLSLAFLRLERRAAIMLTSATAVALLIAVTRFALILSDLAWPIGISCVAFAVFPWFVDLKYRTQIATICGVVLAAVPFIIFSHIADGSATFGGAAYVIAVFALWKNRSQQTPKLANWGTGLVLLLASVGAAAKITWDEMNFVTPGMNIAGLAIVGLCAAMLFACKDVKTVRTATCTCLVLFSVLYLGMVGFEIRENHRESLANMNLFNEAKNIRKLAGIG